MSGFRPFRAMRFHDSVSDPFAEASWRATEDDRTSERRQEVHAVHLLDPEGRPEDRSKYVRFAASAARIASWRRQEVLVIDDQPSHPGLDGFRAGLIHLDTQEVLPAAPVTPAAREERRRLIEATRTYVEFPVGLQASNGGPILIIEGEVLYEAAREHRKARGARADGKGEEWMPIWLGDLGSELVQPLPICVPLEIGEIPAEPLEAIRHLAKLGVNPRPLGPLTPSQSPTDPQKALQTVHHCRQAEEMGIEFPPMTGDEAMQAMATGLPMQWRAIGIPKRSAGRVMFSWQDFHPEDGTNS